MKLHEFRALHSLIESLTASTAVEFSVQPGGWTAYVSGRNSPHASHTAVEYTTTSTAPSRYRYALRPQGHAWIRATNGDEHELLVLHNAEASLDDRLPHLEMVQVWVPMEMLREVFLGRAHYQWPDGSDQRVLTHRDPPPVPGDWYATGLVKVAFTRPRLIGFGEDGTPQFAASPSKAVAEPTVLAAPFDFVNE